MERKEKLIILGATSFIGKKLWEKFHMENHYSTLKFSSTDLNLLDPDHLPRLAQELNEQTILIFCSVINRALADDYPTLLKNVTMAENVAKLLRERPIRRCIYFSSADVYGTGGPDPIHEESPTSPTSYYGCAKLFSEIILKMALGDSHSPLTILRLSRIYGKQERFPSPVTCFLKSALADKKILIHGDGSDLIDYVWDNDFLSVIHYFLRHPLSGTFNIATGTSCSLLQLAGLVQEIFPQKIEIVHQKRKDPKRQYVFDTTRLQQAIGPFSFSPLPKGVRELYEDLTHGQNESHRQPYSK